MFRRWHSCVSWIALLILPRAEGPANCSYNSLLCRVSGACSLLLTIGTFTGVYGTHIVRSNIRYRLRRSRQACSHHLPGRCTELYDSNFFSRTNTHTHTTLANKVPVSICISFWHWNLDADLSCFEGLLSCPEAESVLFHHFCIFHIDPPGHEFGAPENASEHSSLSADDLADQVAEVLDYFGYVRQNL